jgi:major vault protein
MIGVWTGYAVKIVSKTGEQRVIVGPKTALLEYDETVEPFSLSAGKPKGTKPAVRDVYLRVKANKVSDIIEEAETKDFVRVRIPISYRVNFEGDEKKWFDVEDYVKFLCDHLRSLITNTVKKYGIEEFNLNYIDILRDAILGTTGGESKERTGRSFEENGMRIYDVELGRLEIGNDGIAKLLQDSQHESVRHALEINARRKDLEVTTEKERIAQQISKARAETTAMDIEINKETTKIRHGYDLEKANNEVELETKRLEAQVANQQQEDEIAKAELQRQKNRDDQKLSVIKEETDIKTGAKERELKAITPGLIEAMMTQGEMGLAQALAKNLPQSIHHADGISAVLDTVKDTPIGRGLEQLLRKREKVKTRD